jgi:hypothetical protein
MQLGVKNTTEIKTDSPGQGKQAYFCRGCGQALPLGSRRVFHKECLEEDKRLRVRQQRRQQHEQFVLWLRQQTCQKCGARCGLLRPERAAEAPCEPSQQQ